MLERAYHPRAWLLGGNHLVIGWSFHNPRFEACRPVVDASSPTVFLSRVPWDSAIRMLFFSFSEFRMNKNVHNAMSMNACVEPGTRRVFVRANGSQFVLHRPFRACEFRAVNWTAWNGKLIPEDPYLEISENCVTTPAAESTSSVHSVWIKNSHRRSAGLPDDCAINKLVEEDF